MALSKSSALLRAEGVPLRTARSFRCPFATFTPFGRPRTRLGNETVRPSPSSHSPAAGVYSMKLSMSAAIQPELAKAGLTNIPLTGQDADTGCPRPDP